MTTELWYLFLTSVLLTVLWIPFVVGSVKSFGPLTAGGISVRAQRRVPALGEAANRAHVNLVEQFGAFAGLVVVAHLANIHNAVTVWCAFVVLLDRAFCMPSSTFPASTSSGRAPCCSRSPSWRWSSTRGRSSPTRCRPCLRRRYPRLDHVRPAGANAGMEWHDEGIVLSARKHGETSAILEVMTRGHGRHLGLVRGGRSRRQQPVLQPGNRLSLTWRARLDEHLGTFLAEPLAFNAARLLDNACAVYGLLTLAAHLRLLPERDPHAALYETLAIVIEHLGDPRSAAELVARFELLVLEELGFGLDLTRCAATGSVDDLAYVSPKTGRAVSREAGKPWQDSHDSAARLHAAQRARGRRSRRHRGCLPAHRFFPAHGTSMSRVHRWSPRRAPAFSARPQELRAAWHRKRRDGGMSEVELFPGHVSPLGLGVVPREDLPKYRGLELLQRIIDGKYPAPPMAGLLNFTLTEVTTAGRCFAACPANATSSR